MKRCPYCEADVSDSARKCRHCGEWIGPADRGVPTPACTQRLPSEPAESYLFALLTLLTYLLIFPVGLILNVAGLFTGPRRGCFLAMFLVVMLPCAAVVGSLLFLMVQHSAVFDEFVRGVIRAL